jgi:hypothetical protein
MLPWPTIKEGTEHPAPLEWIDPDEQPVDDAQD